MRLGLIADLHGNLLALEAVLAELGREQVDEVLCLGDVAVGPRAVETVERVAELGCTVVMGNWDAYFLEGFPKTRTDLERKLVDIGEWWSRQLKPAHREYMKTFQRTVERTPVDRMDVLAFHGSPRSFEDLIFATTPAEELDRMLDGRAEPVLLSGHTHFQMVRRHRSAILVNPGSVGLPFLRPAPLMKISPWAEYGLLSVEDGRLQTELRRTSFDVEAHVRLIRESDMPHAEWWAGLWALDGQG